MLRLSAGQVESLWDEVLPVEVRELPEDLARIDALLSDPGLLAPVGCSCPDGRFVSGPRPAAAPPRPERSGPRSGHPESA